MKVRNWHFSITWFKADVDLTIYEKVVFFTQLSYHLMRKLMKNSSMLSSSKAVVREEIILYGQGYGAIKTWEKKIFYDLLWPNEISDLNNFNTTTTTTILPCLPQPWIFPRLFYNQCRINFLKMQPQKCATFSSQGITGSRSSATTTYTVATFG